MLGEDMIECYAAGAADPPKRGVNTHRTLRSSVKFDRQELDDAEIRGLDTTLPSTALKPNGLKTLVRAEIEHTLSDPWRGHVSVEAVATTGSTNEDLMLRARVEQPAGCLLRAADVQTQGRGRQARVWRAASGDALLFSVSVPVASVPPSLPAITLACGVALAECLGSHHVAVNLKWPNDIRVRGRKLAGILTELVVDRLARYTLVIGVGMNLRLSEAERHAIGVPAIGLEELLRSTVDGCRGQWIGRLGSAILTAADEFIRDGFDPFCLRFNQLLEARGEVVDVIEGDQNAASGRIVEVDRFGRLIIESEGVTRRVSAGDVSLREKP